MKKTIQDFEIISNQKLNEDYYLLKLQTEIDLPIILPAQFVEIKITKSPNTFLRRPVSIHNVNYDKRTISLLISIVGEGTKALSEIKIGEFVNIIFPLGNSYSLPSTNKVLLVGGGIGVAPILYTAKYFLKFGIESTILLGYRSKDNIVLKDHFAKYGNVFYTTDNGSYGEKGNVLDHSIFSNPEFYFEKIYACGPEIMLKNLSAWANSNNIECEVSLENLMACGIGACLCCVQNTKHGHKCVCTEGPVFNSKEIIW